MKLRLSNLTSILPSSLLYKISFMGPLVLLVVLSLLNFTLLYFERNKASDLSIKSASGSLSDSATLVQQIIEYSLRYNVPDLAQNAMANLTTNRFITSVILILPDNTIQSASQRALIGQNYSSSLNDLTDVEIFNPELLEKALEVRNSRRSFFYVSKDQKYASHLSPVKINSDQAAILQINYDLESRILNSRSQSDLWIRLYGSAFVLVFLLLILGFYFSISKRTSEIAGAIQKFSSGRRDVILSVSGRDEIGTIAAEINKLFKRLSTSEGLLNRHVAELKDLNILLTEAKHAAEAANLAKSTFLANMSHEIRTPLGAVLGFAELITDPNVGPSQGASYIAAIKRNSELLANIINDILDLSKIEANKMQISLQQVGLSEILMDTKTLLDLQAKDKGIVLNIALEDNLPEIINTDPLRLRQILINIIGNAIKFTSRGSVDVSIHRKSTKDAKYILEFTVKDTGLGISQDQVEKLFAPFSQGDDTSKRKFGGTGLGLVISKRFANLLGGDVVLVQTAPGKGSTFSITIDPGPFQFGNLTKEGKLKSAVLHEDRPPLAGIKVLLVEDSPDNQLLISRFLKLAGATVDTASDGKEGIEKAGKNNYDVLLMDLQMPVMDGYEATAALRKKGYSGKIIALTAHALAEERERCLKSGFDDHLSKPIIREILIQRVEYWAGQKKLL